MAEQQTLQEFPCDYLFKAFGSNDPAECFAERVVAAVNDVVTVPRDAFKQRTSCKGGYLCVSVVAYLHNDQQRQRVYASLRQIEGLRYLL
ncbi:MAG: DUF493 domain-containing protein [Desulfuromonadaceae bacterium]|nr:DUF493 domain-containing protein [Desulfuromonadaceae bacterium]